MKMNSFMRNCANCAIVAAGILLPMAQAIGEGHSRYQLASKQEAPRVVGSLVQKVTAEQARQQSLPQSWHYVRIWIHRAKTDREEVPENSLEGIRLGLKSLGLKSLDAKSLGPKSHPVDGLENSSKEHSDGFWLTGQRTKDNQIVLYRDPTLKNANMQGKTSDYTARELQRDANIGYNFAGPHKDYPFRKHPIGMPTLEEALEIIPENVPVIVDLKDDNVALATKALADFLEKKNAWKRVIIYSTDPACQKVLENYPKAQVFLSRPRTVDLLVDVMAGRGCVNPPATDNPAMYEMERPLAFEDKTTLNDYKIEVMARMWSKRAVQCFRTYAPSRDLIANSVDDEINFLIAQKLGLDVLTNKPEMIYQIRKKLIAEQRHKVQVVVRRAQG